MGEDVIRGEHGAGPKGKAGGGPPHGVWGEKIGLGYKRPLGCGLRP